VPPEYDNLIAKLMVNAGDRGAAIDRLRRALDETEVSGIQTTIPFHRFVATDPSFRAAELSTGWVGEHWDGAARWRDAARLAQLAAGLAAQGALGGNGAMGAGRAAGTRPLIGTAARADAGGSRDGTWRTAGVEAAIDRWPR
jgi:acetyl/propionyl-CoA carboxylase alpha subunit